MHKIYLSPICTFFFRAINNSCDFPQSYIANSLCAWRLLYAPANRRLLLFLLNWNNRISNRRFWNLQPLSHLSNPMWKRGKRKFFFVHFQHFYDVSKKFNLEKKIEGCTDAIQKRIVREAFFYPSVLDESGCEGNVENIMRLSIKTSFQVLRNCHTLLNNIKLEWAKLQLRLKLIWVELKVMFTKKFLVRLNRYETKLKIIWKVV